MENYTAKYYIPHSYSIDKQKALKLAKDLGLKISFNSSNSGVIIKNEGKETFLKFEELFPELKELKDI